MILSPIKPLKTPNTIPTVMKHLLCYTLFISILYLSCSDGTDDGDTILITDTEDTDTDPTGQDFIFINSLSFEWRLDELPDTYTTTTVYCN